MVVSGLKTRHLHGNALLVEVKPFAFILPRGSAMLFGKAAQRRLGRIVSDSERADVPGSGREVDLWEVTR